jgi:PAS domain S-box-containing protein
MNELRRSPGWTWAATAAGLALVVGLTVLDAHWSAHDIVVGTVVIGPLLTALIGSPRQTMLVAVAALVAAAASGVWNDDFSDAAYAVRTLVVAVGGVIAVLGARSLGRLAVDQLRFRLLRGAAEISDVARSVDETVQMLGDLLVPTLADIGVIDVVRDAQTRRLAVAAHGPRAAEIEAGLHRRGQLAATLGAAPEPGVSAMRDGRALLIERASDELARAAAHDEEDLAFLRSLDSCSTIVVPLLARGRTIGSMALMTTGTSGRRYGAGDLEFARVLSGRVALALDNAGLFRELESLEAQQTAALSSLAEAVYIEDVAGRWIYANAAAAEGLGFATPEELLAAPRDERAAAFAITNTDGTPVRPDQMPGPLTLRGEDPEPLLLRFVERATGEERWRIVKATAVRDRDDRPRLAVNVIEDVSEVKRVELAQRFLAQAGDLLSASMDYERTLRQVVELAVPQLADWCGVSVPDEHGYVRSVAIAHVDPDRVSFAREYNERYPERLDAETGAAQVIREGVSQLINDITDELLEASIADPAQLDAIRDLGMRAAMIVPMAAAGGVIGAISFVSAESGRRFTPADLELAEELGRRAGTAIENARLYTERSHIARTLQNSLLPDALPDIPGFEVASLYRPAGEETFVGGDFYDAFATARGWMVLIGDVTGRGAEAAALTAQTRHTLRTAGRLLGDPVRTTAHLNAELVARQDLSVCTVALVGLEPALGGGATATVLCAGHPPPLLIRGGEVRPVGTAGLLVGAWPEAEWPTVTIGLEPGDQLVLYTDGVTDAIGREGRFGHERLVGALAPAHDPFDAVARVRMALEAFEDRAQADDTAIIAVQVAPVAVERWTAAAEPESVGALRRAVAEFAAASGASDERLGEVRLAVSEALSNAVVHGYREGATGELTVQARTAEDRLVVVVEDRGVGIAPRPDSPGAGIGLPLIASLTTSSHIMQRPGGGTRVSMTFHLA